MSASPGSAGDLEQLEARLRSLVDQGVRVVDPRQTYLGPEVELARIEAGVVLHPGTRLMGAHTVLGPGAEVGFEGPATLVDAALGEGAGVASGYLEGSVLLDGARLGAQAHLRPGCLLEEGASTAHCVGLKHTILLPFVTLGSLINLCDCLVAGGSSRTDHSEVGSGFIHFNFTPWGRRGDKATPSLVGDVVHGVFLREPRIFLGGSGGMVGPRRVGYGAIAGAGQVLRRDLDEGRLSLRATREVERELLPHQLDPIEPRAGRNRAYLGQLAALRAWTLSVRRARARQPWAQAVLERAVAVIELAMEERHRRLEAFVAERGGALPPLPTGDGAPACPLPIARGPAGHLDWLRSLSDSEVAQGRDWLAAVAGAMVAALE